MKKLLTSVVLMSAILCASIGSGHAQATRTWVSGVGNDANPCSRTAPCKTFPGAISQTAAGGEIDVLDPGGFGAVTITKSITIAAEGSGEGGILVAGTNGIAVNAGPNDIVILRGLQIDGGPPGSNSLAGVKFNTGAKLTIQNSSIRNFTGGSPNGYGVSFTPSGASSLLISDTVISSNGSGTTGGGIYVAPSGTGSAKVNLVRVLSANNTIGIQATGQTKIMVDQTTVANNSTNGIQVNGTASVLLSNSVVTGNNVGLFKGGNGKIFSFGNNAISGNTTDGTPSSTLPLQ